MTHELPLKGIRVVDFSRVIAGPHCAMTLLDLGAEARIAQFIESGALVFAESIAALAEGGHDDPQLNMFTSVSSTTETAT